jgi:hypothetical protein
MASRRDGSLSSTGPSDRLLHLILPLDGSALWSCASYLAGLSIRGHTHQWREHVEIRLLRKLHVRFGVRAGETHSTGSQARLPGPTRTPPRRLTLSGLRGLRGGCFQPLRGRLADIHVVAQRPGHRCSVSCRETHTIPNWQAMTYAQRRAQLHFGCASVGIRCQPLQPG